MKQALWAPRSSSQHGCAERVMGPSAATVWIMLLLSTKAAYVTACLSSANTITLGRWRLSLQRDSHNPHAEEVTP